MLKVIDYIFYEIKYRFLNLYYFNYGIISNFLIVLNKAQWIDIILYASNKTQLEIIDS